MPDIINNNQDQPEEMATIEIHLDQVAKTQNGWSRESFEHISELRKLANSPEVTTFEGASKMEVGLKNIGMPGILNSGFAVDQLSMREEAMFEEQALREQKKSYLNLNPPAKEEALARTYNGYTFRKDWQMTFDLARANGQQFEIEPTSPIGQRIQAWLKIMVNNEIRLIAARNPKLNLDYHDDAKINSISDQIIADPEFIKLLNEEKNNPPDITKIIFFIEKNAVQSPPEN